MVLTQSLIWFWCICCRIVFFIFSQSMRDWSFYYRYFVFEKPVETIETPPTILPLLHIYKINQVMTLQWKRNLQTPSLSATEVQTFKRSFTVTHWFQNIYCTAPFCKKEYCQAPPRRHIRSYCLKTSLAFIWNKVTPTTLIFVLNKNIL